MYVSKGMCMSVLLGAAIGAVVGYILTDMGIGIPLNTQLGSSLGFSLLAPVGLAIRCFGGCIGIPFGAFAGMAIGGLLDWKHRKGKTEAQD